MARKPVFAVDLRPTNSNAPTFYSSGIDRNFLLTGRLSQSDAEKIKNRFSKSPYARDYTAVVIGQNPVLTPEWEANEVAKNHANLNRNYEKRLERLRNMYPVGKQPTGGSVSNSQ